MNTRKLTSLLLCLLLLFAAFGCGRKSAAEQEIDIDLSVLSTTMVYSEIYNMVWEPEGYIGKTVKMSGQFASYHDENTGNNYFSCIVMDELACCSEGLEFILTDDYAYPDDYPEEGGKITIVGVFDTYMEDEDEYCTLRNARIL